MQITFTEWNAGHHCITPEPIPVFDLEHAKLILTAISCAVIQGSSFRAVVMDGDMEIARFFACEDYLTEDC